MEVASNHKWEDDGGPPGGGGGGGGSRRPTRMAGEGGGGGGGNVPFSKMVFDGKRMRKAIQRRTVDYNHSVARWMQVRLNTLLIFLIIKIFFIPTKLFLICFSFFFFSLYFSLLFLIGVGACMDS